MVERGSEEGGDEERRGRNVGKWRKEREVRGREGNGGEGRRGPVICYQFCRSFRAGSASSSL